MSSGTEIFDKVKDWDGERLSTSRWLVIGAGALGNEVLKNLALLGVGEIVVMDFDEVESGNLSRSVLYRQEDVGETKASVAARKLRALNPGTRVFFLDGDVICDAGLGLFARADVIMGCVDNRLARLMINRYAFRVGKPWINGGIQQLAGEVGAFIPGESCYECRITPVGWREIRQRMSCPDLALRYAERGRAVTTPLSAAVAAAMMVNQGLKLLFDGAMPGQSLKMNFDLSNDSFISGAFAPPGETCDSHFYIEDMLTLPEIGFHSTIGELFVNLREYFSGELWIQPEYELIANATPGQMYLPRLHFPVSDDDLHNRQEPGFSPDQMIHRIAENFPTHQLTLGEIGIPFFGVIKCGNEKKSRWVKLGKDLDFFHSGGSEIPSYRKLKRERA